MRHQEYPFYEQRVRRFHNLRTDPFYGKDLARLNHDEINFITKFFAKHGDKDNDQYTLLVNRIGLSGFDQLPRNKNMGLITDILLASRVKG